MKVLTLFFAIVVTPIVCGSCDRTKQVPDAARSQVTIAIDRPPASLDPLKVLDVNSHMVAAALHASLALVDHDQRLRPVMAEDMEMGPDGRACTIKLRKATFWDGSAVTADDVIYSFLRIRRSGHPHRWIFDRLTGVTEFDGGKADSIAGLSAVDGHTVQVSFSSPDPGFLNFIACEVCSIVKRGSDTAGPREYDTHIVGCGPFRPTSMRPGASFEFVQNDGFPVKSEARSMRFVVIDNPQNQLSDLAKNQVDLVRLRGPLLSEACTRKGTDHLVLRDRFAAHRIISEPANELTFILLNWKSKPLTTVPQERRHAWANALAKAFDRSRMAETLYLGQAISAGSIVPPSTLPTNSETSTSVSTRESFGGMRLTLLCSNDPDSRRLAAYVQAEAKNVGLELDLAFHELSQLVPKLLTGEFEASLFWIEQAVPGGPLPWLQFWRSDSPFAAVGQPIDQVREEQAAARGMLSSIERQAAYVRLVSRIDREQFTWIPLLSRDVVFLSGSRLKDLFLDANGVIYYAFLNVNDK